MDNNDPWIDKFKGYRLEKRLFKKISLPLIREFDVRRVRPIWASIFEAMVDANLQFEDDIDDAADAGKITEDEWILIRTTDLIMRALRNSDGATTWFAVEASAAVATSDIERARQSAHAITKMYEQDAIPLVCGYRISNPQRQQACEQGVHAFIVPDNDYPA